MNRRIVGVVLVGVLFALLVVAQARISTTTIVLAPSPDRLSALLLSADNEPLSGRTLVFTLDDIVLGSALTDGTGRAVVLWSGTGSLLKASFSGDEQYAPSSDEFTLPSQTSAEQSQEPASIESGPTESTSQPIKALQDCETVSWTEEDNVVGACHDYRSVTTCADEPFNTSCSTETVDYPYTCITGTQQVQKSREDCVTTGYELLGKVRLSTPDYACTVTQSGDDVVAECDARFDSDFNGVCSPQGGESCQKFIVHPDGSMEQYEKNSRADYVPSDGKYFLERIQTEVLG